MTEPRKMSLIEEAAYLTAGAERARLAGDTVAMIVLLSAAQQRITLHKIFEAEPLGAEFEEVWDKHAKELYEP